MARMEGIYLVYFIGKNEKTFRDLGSGLMTTEKEDFIVIYGDN